MSRYIDADELKSKIINTPTKALDEVELWTNDIVMTVIKRQREIFDMIDKMPAADVEPVGHGEWKPEIGYDPRKAVQCSNCRLMNYEPTEYCPRCGAKMQFMGGGENEQRNFV